MIIWYYMIILTQYWQIQIVFRCTKVWIFNAELSLWIKLLVSHVSSNEQKIQFGFFAHKLCGAVTLWIFSISSLSASENLIQSFIEATGIELRYPRRLQEQKCSFVSLAKLSYWRRVCQAESTPSDIWGVQEPQGCACPFPPLLIVLQWAISCQHILGWNTIKTVISLILLETSFLSLFEIWLWFY